MIVIRSFAAGEWIFHSPVFLLYWMGASHFGWGAFFYSGVQKWGASQKGGVQKYFINAIYNEEKTR